MFTSRLCFIQIAVNERSKLRHPKSQCLTSQSSQTGGLTSHNCLDKMAGFNLQILINNIDRQLIGRGE